MPTPAPATAKTTATAAASATAPAMRTWPQKRPWPLGRTPMPETYKLRVTGDHVGAALAGGGSRQTEAAVQAALQMAGRASKRRRPLGSPAERGRPRDHARRPQPPQRRGRRRYRHDRPGPVGDARQRQYAPPRRLSGKCPPRPELPPAIAGCRRLPVGHGRPLCRHVLPCDCHLRPGRGLRHDRRTAAGAAAPPGHRLHDRRPGSLRRRLALQAPRRRRHQPARLAVHGLEECRDGGNPHAGDDAAGHHSLPAIRGIPRQRRPGILSAAGSRPAAR